MCPPPTVKPSSITIYQVSLHPSPIPSSNHHIACQSQEFLFNLLFNIFQFRKIYFVFLHSEFSVHLGALPIFMSYFYPLKKYFPCCSPGSTCSHPGFPAPRPIHRNLMVCSLPCVQELTTSLTSSTIVLPHHHLLLDYFHSLLTGLFAFAFATSQPPPCFP